MKKFKLVEGVEESVAYALTALEKYNFKPSSDEQECYGIFDLGSIHTDFDFGVYRGIKDSEDDYIDEDKDYRLIHFGANSYRNLGGEKLLKYLAFEIFKANKKRLYLDDGTMIQFTLDEGRAKAECVGFESLINNQSIYANRNMYNLMEKLRWAWEGAKPSEEYLEEDYKYGRIFVDLINNKGEIIPNFELSSFKENEDGSADFIDLQELLRKRIDMAVESFFHSMKEAFSNASNNKKYCIKSLDQISNINIFLAGNSSKSKLFQDILNSYISDGKAKEILGLDENCPLKFTIYPLLGTEEARRIQQQSGYHVDIEDKTEPTGKTSVAYGLLIDRVDVKTVFK